MDTTPTSGTFYPNHLWHNDKKVVLDGGFIARSHPPAVAQHSRNAKNPFLLTSPAYSSRGNAVSGGCGAKRKQFPQFEDLIGKYSHGTRVKNPVAAFAGMMTRMDRGIGGLDLLTELKIADNTLVLFTSDNGPHYEGARAWLL